ncbi:hypothetical protein HYV22_02195 [Candidatus Gottesmanbacteria bacterium]|nr:hypothetical protein [Candidatus Gottesmanbacteria bacterium]
MTRLPFFKIQAKTHLEFGFKLGLEIKKKVEKSLQQKLEHFKLSVIERYIREIKPYLSLCQEYTPDFIEELKGLSRGAKVPFEHIFLINCREVFDKLDAQRCTTVVVKNKDGYLIGHNEDWEEEGETDLYVVKAKIGSKTIFGLNFSCELLGNSICFNSFGIIQAINDLAHTDRRVGLPKNFIARKILEAKDKDEILEILGKYPRASGFNHVIITKGQVYNIETTAFEVDLQRIDNFPFVHTNHYLSKLKKYEAWGSPRTFKRYKKAVKLASKIKTTEDLYSFLGNREGYPASVCNNETNASVIVSSNDLSMKVFLPKK